MSSSLLYPLKTSIFLKTWGKGTQKKPTAQIITEANSAMSSVIDDKYSSTERQMMLCRGVLIGGNLACSRDGYAKKSVYVLRD